METTELASLLQTSGGSVTHRAAIAAGVSRADRSRAVRSGVV